MADDEIIGARAAAERAGIPYQAMLALLDSGRVKGAFRIGERGKWRMPTSSADAVKRGELEPIRAA